jgi:hypothetical protein
VGVSARRRPPRWFVPNVREVRAVVGRGARRAGVREPWDVSAPGGRVSPLGTPAATSSHGARPSPGNQACSRGSPRGERRNFLLPPEVGRTLRPDLPANQRGGAATAKPPDRPSTATTPYAPHQPTTAGLVDDDRRATRPTNRQRNRRTLPAWGPSKQTQPPSARRPAGPPDRRPPNLGYSLSSSSAAC